MILSYTIALLLFSAIRSCLATSNWTNPNARLPSFSSTYLVGERIFLSWLSLNTSRDDLWLTRYNKHVDSYSLRITSDLDLSTDGSFAWTVAVADEVVLTDTRFVFAFLPRDSAFEANIQAQTQLQSPAFNIMLVNQVSPPNGTVGSTSASPSATSSTKSPSTTDISTTPAPTYLQKDSGPITGRNIGIAMAVVAVVAFVGFAVGYLVFRKRWIRHNRKTNIGDSTSDITLSGPYEVLAESKRPMEMNGKETRIHEIVGSKESVAHQSDSAVVHEANTIIKRPGLHEMAG